jgi:hypothetical protein
MIGFGTVRLAMGIASNDIMRSPAPRDDARIAQKFAPTVKAQPASLETLIALEPQWTDLARQSGEKNIFLFPWTLIPSWPLLEELHPKLLTVWEKDLLIGLQLVRSDKGYAKLPVPFLRTAVHHEQYLATPLVRAGYESAFAKGLCDWLDGSEAQNCFLNLALTSGDGPVHGALIAHCEAEGRASLAANCFTRAAIEVAPEASEAFDSKLSANRRKSLSRARSKLERLGKLRVERLSKAEDLASWIDGFFAMEDTGWKHDNASSILSCPTETALYSRMIKQAFDDGELNFTRLCIDDRPIAYTLDVTARPYGFCLKSAIDQDYRKYSPGVLMEYETLKFYSEQSDCTLLDSCTAPDNAMLNELWPHQKPIMDLVIARKGLVYGAVFSLVAMMKARFGARKDAAK